MSNLNLDTSPYFDDFDANKDYYKVLFKPGFPVQARELTSLQTILQNQVEKFGRHFFNEGAMVIPGGITYNAQYESVQINPQQGGVDVLSYINGSIGKTVIGSFTGVRAKIVNYVTPPSEGVENITLFVVYSDSGISGESQFVVNEPLLLEEALRVRSGATIPQNGTLATTFNLAASATGSSVSISDGVYFAKSTFIQVKSQSIIVDPYSNLANYSIGLKLDEKIITATQDNSLYDNAKGFNNFSAPGADRYQIVAKLIKKPLSDDSNEGEFIELLRLVNGVPQPLGRDNADNKLLDILAQRTFDESGNYVVDGLGISLDECLNNLEGNNGVYTTQQVTNNGNTPSDDLLCTKISSGTAYVKGYSTRNETTTVIDVEKPRTTESSQRVVVPFEMGNLLRINTVTGTPLLGLNENSNIITFHSRRKNGSSPVGDLVGEARAYSLSLEDSAYVGDSTPWNLYLYDVQFFSKITLNVDPGSSILVDYVVRGLSSNSFGYVRSVAGSDVTLTQVSGNFFPGESISVNGERDDSFSISDVDTYSAANIASVYQNTSSLDPNISSNFYANTVLYSTLATNFLASDLCKITSGGVVNSPGKNFNTFKVDQLVTYQNPENTTEFSINRVVSVSADGSSMTLGDAPNVSGVVDGTLPSSTINVPLRISVARVLNTENSELYAELETPNVSSVSLANSSLIFSGQITNQNVASGTLTVNVSQLNVPTATFLAFDQERYSVVYSDGTVAALQSNQVTVGETTLQITGLNDGSGVTVNVTASKNTIRSKTKVLNRSIIFDVDKTASSSNTINDLTINQYYGLRVEDDEISLNVPDVSRVLAVYESTGTDAPRLDQAVFPAASAISSNTIIGEKMIGVISNAVGRVVSTTASTVDFVSLNQKSFLVGEEILFDESSLRVEYQGLNIGNYRDITTRYTLDRGQRAQFYDYSRIRLNGNSKPSKKLRIIYDAYLVPSNDVGDVYTSNSYTKSNYSRSIPILPGNVRATDTLDFRPRVSNFTSTTASPFAFSSRQFANSGSAPNLVVAPNEGITLSYDYYLGRIDMVVLDKERNLKVIQGVPSRVPGIPSVPEDVMALASIALPAYLYDLTNARITNIDNKRYTMRDIGAIDDRVSVLEEATALSLLEQSTASLQVLDADGNSRFKNGFFADPFTSSRLLDLSDRELGVEVIPSNGGSLRVATTLDSVPLLPELNPAIDVDSADLSQNLDLRDSNTRKTGNKITLDYEEVSWISQQQSSFEINVNPFEVVLFNGILDITPNQFEFTISRKIDIRRFATAWGAEGEPASKIVTENTSVEDTKLDFVSERNLAFSARLLRPRTQYYTFVDNHSGISIVPKLLEIAMISGVFETGEVITQSSTIRPVSCHRRNFWGQITSAWGWFNNRLRSRNPSATPTSFTGRVASPNHKFGSYDNPTEIYSKNPYDISQVMPVVYGATSTILNIDTLSLAENSGSGSREINHRFGGNLEVGDIITGQSSGAVASIREIRLVSDTAGDVLGSYYIPEGNDLPDDALIVNRGTQFDNFVPGLRGRPSLGTDPEEFFDLQNNRRVAGDSVHPRLQTSPDVQRPQFTLRTGTRTFRITSDEQNREATLGGPSIAYADANVKSSGKLTVRTTIRTEINLRPVPPPRPVDPLAQTFRVDGTGAFITSVDIYFANKSNTDNLLVELRETQLGTPLAGPMSAEAVVVVPPSRINVSGDSSVATNIKFPSPIYLEVDKTYAVVLLAPTTNDYLVWAGRMLEPSIETGAIISKQYINGTLFKSQNGSIWTTDQTEDLKFTLYKAKFTTNQGTVFLANSPLVSSRSEKTDPITTYPRKILAPVTGGFNYSIGSIVAATTSDEPTTVKCEGIVEALGGSSTTTQVLDPGSNYIDGSYTNVPTVNIDSTGDGLTADVTVIDGVISSVAVNDGGSGYRVGDVVGLTTSQIGESGGDSLITVSAIGNTDTLFLTEINGEEILSTDLINIKTGSTLTQTGDVSTADSNAYSPIFSGDVFSLYLYNHGMQADENTVYIGGVLPDGFASFTTQSVSVDSNVIVVDDDSQFATFEGQSTVEGYVIIDGEIITYTFNGDGTLGIVERGVDGTPITTHNIGSEVFKYSASGVSLRRINTSIDFTLNQLLGNTRTMDTVFLRIDRSDRNSGSTLLSFNQQQSIGGYNVNASKNIQFNAFEPSINLFTPINTSVKTTLTAISGTSAGGNELSFQNLGDIEAQNLTLNTVEQPLLAASDVNVNKNLVPIGIRNGISLSNVLSTTDENLSPMIDVRNCTVNLQRNRLNDPVSNYAEDPRVKFNNGDPHSAIYISQTISLANPASSLKVLTTSYRDQTADMRVLYKLYGVDSTGSTEPTWELFPGFTNMLDTNGDGFGDEVIDTSKNNGLPNKRVRPSLATEYLEYEYEVNDLSEFNAFQIKIVFSGTNEAKPPILENIRAIALS